MLEKRGASRGSWARRMLLWHPSASALFRMGTWHQRLALCSRFLTRSCKDRWTKRGGVNWVFFKI
jgi:hypothetical protein